MNGKQFDNLRLAVAYTATQYISYTNQIMIELFNLQNNKFTKEQNKQNVEKFLLQYIPNEKKEEFKKVLIKIFE